MEGSKTLKLSTVAQEFNCSLEKIIDLLAVAGHPVENDTNAKIGAIEYSILLNNFKNTEKQLNKSSLQKIEYNDDSINIILQKALVCLNISSTTFVKVLAKNGIQVDIKEMKVDVEPRHIVLTPKMYVSLSELESKIQNDTVLTTIEVLTVNGAWKNIRCEPYALNEFDIYSNKILAGQTYQSTRLPEIKFLDFCELYNYEPRDLREKMASIGFTFEKMHKNTYQKLPLEIYLKYLQLENQPVDTFLHCSLTPKQMIIHGRINSREKSITQREGNNINKLIMKTSTSPVQRILFGSPGTGKSFQIVDAENSYYNRLTIDDQKPDLIKTVFHPEYTYGDFMGKLMPLTVNERVVYQYYPGHFLQALGTAYKNIVKAYIAYHEELDELEKDFKSEMKKNKGDYSDEQKAELNRRISAVKKPVSKNVLFVIDEINRGNSAAIFGTAFQLLDRDSQGWSTYAVKISDMEVQALQALTGFYYVNVEKENEVITKFDGKKIDKKKYEEYTEAIFESLDVTSRVDLKEKNIKIPPNMSIVATMNTSDNSIYFMDSAFKRRWDWEFIDITSEQQIQAQVGRKLEDGFSWCEFVDNLNDFIKKYGERIRKIEDKQIGYYFIKDKVISNDQIQSKLMFFLWDSIFSNDKKPIRELIGMDKPLVTFGDFIRQLQPFIDSIKTRSFTRNVL